MLETAFTTDSLVATDRFDGWNELTRGPYIPTISHPEDPAAFQAAVRRLDVCGVRAYAMTGSTIRVTRSARMVRQDDPEHGSLYVIQRGEYRLAQGDDVVRLGPGDLVFADSSRPFEAWMIQDRSASWRHVHVQFPRALLPRPASLDQLVARRLPGQGGLRNLVATYLCQLVAPAAEYHRDAAAGLATTTVDLVATLLSDELGATHAEPPQLHDRALLARILCYMRQHLGHPALRPDTIAAAHHISTRYLHKLFETQELSVAAWIRRHRLERCHRDLADPAHGARSIHAIAARWGFTDKAHFSRLFRATYGTTPSQYRCLATGTKR